MGVPRFYLWLTKKYNNEELIIKKNKLNNKFDYLAIDANSLFHPICMKVVTDNNKLQDNDKLEDIMLKHIIEYIILLIELISPTKGTYIAVDGVAPLAKIKQQRSRRFKSIHDKNLWDNIKKKYNIPIDNHWNNSAITPGTVFMKKLHNYILEWINSTKYKIIYSSCLTPSEGEHKILQFMKMNSNNKYVIYGLDADLIFLALTTNSDKIYLLREANEINNQESKDILNYVSIKIMRQSIVNTMHEYLINSIDEIFNNENKNIYGFDNLNPIKIVNDFIFMCYFLGNDFLPHIPSLDIHQNGIESLIISWVETVNEFVLEKNKIEYLLNGLEINSDFMYRFINKLKISEEDILRNNFTKGKKRMTCDGDAYEKEVFRIENLQFKIHDPIQLGSDNYEQYRERYYYHYWNVGKEELDEFSEKLVIHYLLGIKWVTNYYFDTCPSWDWYYPFEHPPFISDITKHLDKININKTNFKLGEPLKPYMQLLAVLPPQSSYLLPLNISKLMTNPKSSLIYLYPQEFKQDFINKKKYWMGIPKLPPLDIKQIKYSYFKYKNELTKEELERNESKKVFEINIS
jgi:5'-3' exonuclease